MKSFFKAVLVSILGFQVRRLRARHQFKTIGVVGSIGKTSTKLAIAKVLASKFRVRFEEGNYNDLVSVPLVVFGQRMPNIWNILAWVSILIKNEIQIFFEYPFDFVVVELGTDGPGQITQFRKYLHLDVAVMTAVAFEHMEFFRDLNEVADEEWSVAYFSDLLLVNKDLVSIIPENIDHSKIIFYGKNFGSNFKMENLERLAEGFNFNLVFEGKKLLDLNCNFISEVSLYGAMVAAILALRFNIEPAEIKKAISTLEPFAGRMRKLLGKNGSIIIDDTYNASPEAVKIALDTLYFYPKRKKIAILGMMNELGEISKTEHEKIGQYCNPALLSLVVTIGDHANRFLAPKARSKGCQVYEAGTAKKAGEFLLDKIDQETVVLVKGSQNGVFAEEAIKVLLADQEDAKKLVRQTPYWQKRKIHS